MRAGPASNSKQGGVAPRQRQPRLMRGQRAPVQTELGCSGLTRVLFDSRLPLRRKERGPARTGPTLNPWQGGVPLRDRRPGLMWHWTATGWAELGHSGLTRALFDSRLPLRRRESGPAHWGLASNPSQGAVALRQRQLRLMRGRMAPGVPELGRSGLTRALFDLILPLRRRESGLQAQEYS